MIPLLCVSDYNKMQQVACFEQRLQNSIAKSSTAPIADSINQLKALQRDIAAFLVLERVEKNDAISQMQIAVFNNLACLYEKKGKYRTSLYHLQISEQLQNKYFTSKYEGKVIPLSALEKLSTTYSNLSAIQSKLGNYSEAILNAQFAIQVFNKQGNKDRKALLPLYYNYSFLLDMQSKHKDASKFAIQGLRLAKLHADKMMIEKFSAILESLKEKMYRRESRKIKELKKHIKGELGIIKGKREIEEKFIKLAQNIEIYGVQTNDGNKMASTKSNFTTLKQYFDAEKRHIKPQSSKRRHNSTYSTLNSRKNRNFSLTHHPQIVPNAVKLHEQLKSDLLRNQLQSDSSKRAHYIPKTYSEYTEITGKIRSNRLNSTIGGGRDYRIKSRKIRLEQQIDELGRRNDALSKLMNQMNSQQQC